MAKKNKYVVGLDVGTTKTCAIICELNDLQQLEVLGMGLAESKGLRKGVVVNLDAAVSSIKKAIEDAEKGAGTAVESVFVDTDLETYIARLVHETRIDRRVAVGGSPRASLAFLKLARARAALENREFILPDDIKHFAQPVLSHRLILQPEFWMARRVAEEVIRDVIDKVPVPVVRRT